MALLFGFAYPLALVLLGPLAVWVWLFYRREEKSYFIDPWADHLAARLGSGRFRSHRAFLLVAAVVGVGIVALAQPWYGVRQVRHTARSRMVNFQFDVSGSMVPDGLEAARQVARHLIQSHPEDRANICFFASEAECTSFGIPESYLNDDPDLVGLYANQLGGSTVAAHAFYTSFNAIALEDQLFTSDELDKLYLRLCVPTYSSVDDGDSGMPQDAQLSNNGCPVYEGSVEQRRTSFATYLDAYISQHPVKPADRMSVFISDCDLSYEGYDLPSIMLLYKAYGIRLEAVCIGETKLKEKSDPDSHAFVEGILATGGDIRNIAPSRYEMKEGERERGAYDAFGQWTKTITVKRSVRIPVFDNLAGQLQELVGRVEKMKPRETESSVTVEKRLLTDECFWAALGLLILAVFMERRLA